MPNKRQQGVGAEKIWKSMQEPMTYEFRCECCGREYRSSYDPTLRTRYFVAELCKGCRRGADFVMDRLGV